MVLAPRGPPGGHGSVRKASEAFGSASEGLWEPPEVLPRAVRKPFEGLREHSEEQNFDD